MRGADAGYPFSALVGQESLRTALLLGAIDPSLGGVLIRGEKGTAKSTAARALARLLPPVRVVPGCPFRCDPDHPWSDCPTCDAGDGPRPEVEIPTPHVDLPLGATEDRVLGTLDLERVLKDGQTALKPGLLAEAHRGVLYIDEVNLLADHLVDSLLDVATSGINSVQRDGVAARHPSRFLLIGSMNPEEGELRPQLLDRFGLMVEVAAPTDFALRAEVVRRRLAFEANSVEFAARWSAADRALGDQVAEAHQRLRSVDVPDGLLTAITRLCCESQVDGLRADIALYKASRALAALEGRTTVRRADLRVAAEFVLPHRRRRQPFQQPGLDREALDRALGPEGESEPDQSGQPPTQTPLNKPSESADRPDPAEADSAGPESTDPGGEAEQVFHPGGPVATPPLEVDPTTRTRPQPSFAGKHAVRATASRGEYTRAVADESPRELAVAATVHAAAARGAGAGRVPAIERGDLHGKQRSAEVSSLVLFVVDTSGSMGARRRMEAVKAAVLGLLMDAYQRRDRVAVIAFRGPRAEVVLPPTRNVDQAESALRRLPTGGRTPLAHALAMAAEVVATENRHGPTLVVVLTDGRANVPLPDDEGDPWSQAMTTARAIAALGASAVVFDTEEGFGRVGRAAELAAELGGDHLPLAGFSADEVRSRVEVPLTDGTRR